MALVKREILASREVLYTTFCPRKQFLFCKRDAFKISIFSHLKGQLKRKKNWYIMFVKIFQVSADEGMGK